jgi:DNA-binding NarL/FixJ family response regulator
MARAADAIREPARLRADGRPSPITVLIVDEERLFAEALGSVLGKDGIVVGRILESEPTPIDAVRDTVPDVVILGVDTPTHAEFRRGQAILDVCPTARLLILATTLERSQAQRILRAGFHAMTKDASVSRLVRTVRSLASGASLPRADAPSPNGHARRSRPALVRPQLTPRELEVLALIATGAPGRRIARRLGISENTVRTHSQSILVKLQVHSRLEAATLAIRTGLVRLGVRETAGLAG